MRFHPWDTKIPWGRHGIYSVKYIYCCYISLQCSFIKKQTSKPSHCFPLGILSPFFVIKPRCHFFVMKPRWSFKTLITPLHSSVSSSTPMASHDINNLFKLITTAYKVHLSPSITISASPMSLPVSRALTFCFCNKVSLEVCPAFPWDCMSGWVQISINPNVIPPRSFLLNNPLAKVSLSFPSHSLFHHLHCNTWSYEIIHSFTVFYPHR